MRVSAERRWTHAGLDISIVERNDAPGIWTVEAIDRDGDGHIYQAMFAGPEARSRAFEYAGFKYS
jgi:hypothetical protein